MMKGINHLLEKWIASGRSGTMDVDSDAFLDTLARSRYHGPDIEPIPVNPEAERPLRWWEVPYLKGYRFLVIVGIAVFMVTMVICGAIRYINDIVLYDNQLHINSQGAFNPHKSMNCEYAIYLFNTADLWANSGIQVNKKDRIKINISGGHNSAIEGVVNAARYNTELKYRWVSFDDAETGERSWRNSQDRTMSVDTAGLSLCVYRAPDRIQKGIGFGSALCGIFPESMDIQNDPLIKSEDRARRVWRWTPKLGTSFKRAEQSGTLFFAINDMFLDSDDEVETFYNNPGSLNFNNAGFSQKEINARKANKYHDYKDNLGQLMVSVEIQRNVPKSFFKPLMAYRWMEYHAFEALDNSPHFLGRFVALLFYGVCFCGWITALFFVWVFGCVIVMYFFFFVGHQLFTLGEALPNRIRLRRYSKTAEEELS